MDDTAKEGWVKFGIFWINLGCRFLHEAAVLTLVFGCLDQVERIGQPPEGTMPGLIIAAVVMLIVSGSLEWVFQKK